MSMISASSAWSRSSRPRLPGEDEDTSYYWASSDAGKAAGRLRVEAP